MEAKKIAIFDLDGTLADTDSTNSAAYCAALDHAGIRRITGVYGRVTGDTIRATLEGASKEILDDIVRFKIECYSKELWRTRLGPAAMDLQCVLMNRNVFNKVVLLSNGSERRVMETLRHCGWVHFFDEIVCNGGKGSKFENYFKTFDSNPAACVVWENEKGQVMSAIAAGVMMDNIRKVG